MLSAEALPLESEDQPTEETKWKKIKPGIYDDIEDWQYHRGPGISKSGLDLINRSPAHFMAAKKNPKPETATFKIGKAFHCLVLEPDRFDEQYVMEPVNAPKRPTVTQMNAKKPSASTLKAIDFWKEFDEENGSKVILSTKPGTDPYWQPSEWCMVHRMRDAITLHSDASIFTDPSAGKAERSAFWFDPITKRLCKCRPDFDNTDHNLLVDLKSTDDASYTEFGKSCGKWRYFVQDPYYLDGMKEAGERRDGFVFIAVEKQPPYGVGVYILKPEPRRIGRIQYRRNLETYNECLQRQEWPCYREEVRDLEVPAWALKGHIS